MNWRHFATMMVIILHIVVFWTMAFTSTSAHATEINVGGQIIDIPSKYRAWKVEQSANACYNRLIVKVQTEHGAMVLPLSCTQRVLNNDTSWRNE